MSQVFISYAKEDAATAGMLAKALEVAGFTVWWDRHIPPGKTWDEVIGHALDAATCVVVLWSKRSVQSRWVREEAEKAASRSCLIPALVDKVDPPFGFARIQAADLSEWRGGEYDPQFADLLEAVSNLVGTSPHGAAVDEAGERVKPEPQPQNIGSKAEPSPPLHAEPLERKSSGRRIGTYVMSVLAVIGLVAVVYLGLGYFYPAEPRIVSFKAAPISTGPDEPVTLSWQTRNASQVRLEGIGQVALTGQHALHPRETRSYTLTATNARGHSSSSTIQVVVTAPLLENWITLVHGGRYVAKFYLVWEGQTSQWKSGEVRRGYTQRVLLPVNVKTVLLHAQATELMAFGIKKPWISIVRLTDAPVQRTYTVTGTYARPQLSASPPLK